MRRDDNPFSESLARAKLRSASCWTRTDGPWLERLRQQIERSLAAGENAVLACSALNAPIATHLPVSDEVKFVFLRGDYALVEKQLRSRHGHFMNAALLQSQFDDLEEPQPDENVRQWMTTAHFLDICRRMKIVGFEEMPAKFARQLTIELVRTPEEIVERIKAKLHLANSRLARYERFGTARTTGRWCE